MTPDDISSFQNAFRRAVERNTCSSRIRVTFRNVNNAVRSLAQLPSEVENNTPIGAEVVEGCKRHMQDSGMSAAQVGQWYGSMSMMRMH